MNQKRTALLACFSLAIAAWGCGAQTATKPPQSPATEPGTGRAEPIESVREAPPPSGPARPIPFPKVGHDELPNGLHIDIVQAKALPVVQLRLLIKSGSSSDGDLVGAAALTARMLRDGGAGRLSSRDLAARIESLGADLGIEVGPDSTVFSLSVTRTHLDEAMDLLGWIAREPRWDPTEFNKLKKRQTQRATDRAKASGTWAATMLLWRDLYQLPTGMHPYAAYEANASELSRLKVSDCKDFYKKNYSPKNAVMIVAGDVDGELGRRAAEHAFGTWKGPERVSPSYGEATVPEHPRILLADRPKSPQTDIYVAVLGPERREEAWTDAKVMNQILGGGATSRLQAELHDKRSLVQTARSSLGELSHGPVPFAVYASAQAGKTGLAVQVLIDQIRKLASEPPSEEEVSAAKRYLNDVVSLKLDTVGSIADMVVAAENLDLGDEYYDVYRQKLGEVTSRSAFEAAAEAFRDGHWIVAVSGDAEQVGPMLSRFGDVLVFSPDKDFQKQRTIPANPSAPLESDVPQAAAASPTQATVPQPLPAPSLSAPAPSAPSRPPPQAPSPQAPSP